MNIKVLFGTNLKLYRKKRHLSQEQLAEKVDISAKHLSKIERGVTFVSAELLEKLSDTLGISVAQLFCNKDENINESINGNINEKIYYDNLLKKFDGITEKHLMRAMKGIKGDIRREGADD